MIVSVTKKHIADGKAGCCSQCPVALALQDTTNDNRWHCGSTIMWRKGINVDYCTPKEVSIFMQLFDTKKTVEPFSFEINIT